MHPLLLSLAASAASLWQAVLLTAAVALCLRLLPGIPAAVRSLLWTAVLLLTIALHLAPAGTSPAQASAHGGPIHLDPRWTIVLAALWCTLTAVRALQLVSSAFRLRTLAIHSVEVVPTFNPALLEAGPRTARLCTSDDVDRPSVIGFFSPRILLPPALLLSLTPAELEQVILHEMEHLRRADDWTNLLQKLALVVFPIDPVLLWVERRLCLERELACDDRVLSLTGARKAYASCLTKLAEHSLLTRRVSLVLGAWARQSEVARRVHRILRRPERTLRPAHAAALACTLVAALIGGSVALAHSPQWISFTPSVTPAMISTNPAESTTSLHPSPAAHATYVKAVMPQAAPATLKPRRGHAAVRHARQQPSWLVLTSWHQAPRHAAPPAHFIPTYAAIPTQDGWLIVQL